MRIEWMLCMVNWLTAEGGWEWRAKGLLTTLDHWPMLLLKNSQRTVNTSHHKQLKESWLSEQEIIEVRIRIP
jgi:hypothetical protein